MDKDELKQYPHKEQVFIMMKMFGGSFVSMLGHIYFHADPINRKKLEQTFDNYFVEYEIMLNKYLEK